MGEKPFFVTASLAQPVERSAVNRKVTGSIPVGSAYYCWTHDIASQSTCDGEPTGGERFPTLRRGGVTRHILV